MEQPSYYTVIPALVRYDDDLLRKPKSILLYGEIAALSNQKGYCWANNSYFSKRLKVSGRMIQDYLDILVKKGYVARELKYKPGTKQVDKRILSIASRPGEIHFTTPSETDFASPGEADFADNTTSINTTRTNSDDDDTRTCDSSQAGEDPVNKANEADINVDIDSHKLIFNDFINTLGSPVVCWAINRTIDKAHHPNWDYLLTTLRGLEANSVRTVEQAERLSEEYKQKTRQSYRGRNVPQVRETMPDWGKWDKATRTKRASASALAKARARQAKNREVKEGVKS